MIRGSLPSFPTPKGPGSRRFGSRSTRGSRPVEAQTVVLSMIGLMVIAVPLYLLRRPRSLSASEPPIANISEFGGVIRPNQDAGVDNSLVALGPVQKAKCSATPGQRGNEGGLCDSFPKLEAALRRGIRKTTHCAPKTGTQGTLNFVLELDFSRNRLNVFPGKSGEWKGPQARRAAKCVQSTFPSIGWDELRHQYRYYMIAILATYPSPDPLEVLPNFE